MLPTQLLGLELLEIKKKLKKNLRMNAIILDDEQYGADSLHLLLKKYCPEINIIGIENDAITAIEKINILKPHILFLDIELQSTNAFDLIKQLLYVPAIIFTTAYENFAIDAFKVDAVDYLLKPIDYIELLKSIEKVKHKMSDVIFNTDKANVNYIEKISLATNDGIVFIKTSDLIRVEAFGNYTDFIFVDGKRITITKNIGSFDKLFEHTSCKRIHKSHIVNLLHVVKYNKGEGSEAVMINGDTIPIPRDRRDEFVAIMKEYITKERR
jgi:two-component system LytT family response regulator